VMPESITSLATGGREWLIMGVGRGRYEFRLVSLEPIVPNEQLAATKIPDATPEIVSRHAQTDEQALLAKVRYNRIIDIFLGITTFSLQNHLRTSIEDVGQVELDEVYVGVDKQGRQYVVPVQAKGGTDKHSAVQTMQDIACCKHKFPDLICRPVSAQFAPEGESIAMFELIDENGTIKIVDEKHYKLVRASEITADDLASYARAGR
jgi:hypothetical protein